ncbi:MAG: hypothetical protein EU531_06280 [Promethearchaeota archaeon]|nr:MAG: hypothetical protein EU531_06280 [Candidatus Lokiarchaeota archaeon]
MEKKNLFILISFVLSVCLFTVIIILYLIDQMNIPGFPGSLIPMEYVNFFIHVLPGTIFTDLLLLYFFPIVVFAIYILIAPILVQILYKIYDFTFIFRNRPQYGIIQGGTKIKATSIIYRAVLVSLFAFGTTTLMVQLGVGDIFRATAGPGAPAPLISAENIFFGTFFFTPISLLLFVPIWLLEDCGLVGYRSFKDQRKIPVIQGLFKWYMNVIEVYTGLSTIYGYFILIINTFGYFVVSSSFTDPAILTPIILLILPLIITGLFAIPLYFYEKNLGKIKKRIQLRLFKYNIPIIDVPAYEQMMNRENKE